LLENEGACEGKPDKADGEDGEDRVDEEAGAVVAKLIVLMFAPLNAPPMPFALMIAVPAPLRATVLLVPERRIWRV
jgi:hypothetical protein